MLSIVHFREATADSHFFYLLFHINHFPMGWIVQKYLITNIITMSKKRRCIVSQILWVLHKNILN